MIHGVQVIEETIFGTEEPILRVNDWTSLQLGAVRHLMHVGAEVSAERVLNALNRARTDVTQPAVPLKAILLAAAFAPAAIFSTPPAVMGLLCSLRGRSELERRFGSNLPVIPFSATLWQTARIAMETGTGNVMGVAIQNLGLLTFGASLEESREHMQHINVVQHTPSHHTYTPMPALEIANVRAQRSMEHPVLVINETETAPLIETTTPKPFDVSSLADATQNRVFDPEHGVFGVGASVQDAVYERDTALKAAEIVAQAAEYGGFTGWDPEAAPVSVRGQFSGEVVFITGAASGIGRATASVFLERGAAVASIDIDPAICEQFDHPGFLGIHGDVTVLADVGRAVRECVQRFGGLDIAFLNAGINEDHSQLADVNLDLWAYVMKTNLDANVAILREIHPYLKLAPKGGRVVMNASKSAPAPGPGSSSYTVSKAGLTQLARLTALEWGQDGVRVHVVHPNAVFDTKIWKDNMAEKRARHYGMTIEQYKTNNLLKVEIKSRDVAELVADICGDHFAKVTGLQLPIDGGNNRVI